VEGRRPLKAFCHPGFVLSTALSESCGRNPQLLNWEDKGRGSWEWRRRTPPHNSLRDSNRRLRRHSFGDLAGVGNSLGSLRATSHHQETPDMVFENFHTNNRLN